MTSPDNWKTQIRKGYLELCILLVILKETKVYGSDLLEKLSHCELEVKEGTLYPLLNRMSTEGILKAVWETQNLKGHPRKFYSLTDSGRSILEDMNEEYQKMISIYKKLSKK